VNHVLGFFLEHDRAVYRHVELVPNLGDVVVGAESSVRPRIREQPFELLGVHFDRVGIGRHTVAAFHLFPIVVAHHREAHAHHSRKRRPDVFHCDVAVRVMRLLARAGAVLDDEPDHPALDDEKGDPGNNQDRQKHPVDLRRERRRLYRQPPTHGRTPSGRRR